MPLRDHDTPTDIHRAPSPLKSSDEGEQSSFDLEDEEAFADRCNEELGLFVPTRKEIEAEKDPLISQHLSSATEEEKKVVAKKILANLRRMVQDMKENKSLGREGLAEPFFDLEEPATQSVDQILSSMVRAKLNYDDIRPGPWIAPKQKYKEDRKGMPMNK